MKNRIFRDKAINLEPYILSKRFNLSDDRREWSFLDWNESNFDLLDNIKFEIGKALDQNVGVSYPDGDCPKLLSAIEDYLNVSASNVLVYNGSDSALKDVFTCTLDESAVVTILEPEYAQIRTFVQIMGSSIHSIRMDNPYELAVEELLPNLYKNDKLYLSNPNNPTGRFFSKDEITRILDKGVVLFLDEAYVEFAPESCVDLVESYRNLFVFRTFSKGFGLAGFRLGYVVSHVQNIEILQKYRNSKEINAVAQIAAKEALYSLDIYKQRFLEIIDLREDFTRKINNLRFPIVAFSSKANFVVIQTTYIQELIEFLECNKVMIRDRRGLYYMDNSARISIGTKEQMQQLYMLILRFISDKKKSLII